MTTLGGMQARMKENTPLYNANRDLAHNVKAVLQALSRRIDAKAWPELEAAFPELKEADLGRANQAYIDFLMSSCQDPKETMEDVMRRTGWFDVLADAQIAYMAYLGTVIAGITFHGVRETTLGGEGPLLGLAGLQAAGEEGARMMTRPRWQRPLVRLASRVRGAIHALRN